ncbi:MULTISPECIES: type II toxin-antitoxin system VapC family toxin [unclassified Microbacterium]|uniref:type II toxin-antitoxin system VapC family toxin n=1 Tax=unclassified Microbacterium TaxID=2609290 RepID=UPI00160532B1|nr:MULTISPECIES: type II toxin-antitoxin system VapC family toxin [unclassified Microbacterium]QNA92054.1 type II toxin-antitoxin system VapC family toxin [Microbacterium sp. Se63.02b]QYM65286.1 type II toxin-antitoxin system VapC family toxin [Microbacterium sp. Se5.02b]
MIVVDASALLAFLQGEPGSDRVEEILDRAVIGAANWAEVAQKVRVSEADWAVASGLLLSYGLKVEPVSQSDGEAAAGMWRRGSGLSLGDRLCLALGLRLDVPVLTADRAWGESDRIEQLRG